MKAGVHPVYEMRTFHCYGCSSEWSTRTTLKPHTTDGKIHLDICSSCHPFFTGRQRMLDTAGRVEKFRKKYEATPKVDVKAKKKAKADKAAARAAAREE